MVRDAVRTRRTPTGSAAALVGRWRSTRHRPAVPVHPAAGERRPRRRPLARADATTTGRACGSTFDAPRQVSATHHRAADLAAATHHDGARAAPETIVHLDAAHRGLGTASCGPDTLPAYLVGPGHVPLDLEPVAEPAMTIEWRPDDRQFHLHNGLVSLVLRVYEDGSLGHLHLGAPLPRRAGRTATSVRSRSTGSANRVGDPIPFAYPTTGHRRLPRPGARRPRPGRLGTAVALRYASHAIAPGKPPLDPLPSTYVETATRPTP